MLGENKNLKDTSEPLKDTSSLPASSSGESSSLMSPWRDSSGSYSKANKLITALYMVTDTMDKDEPIRLKLRTLGIEILSDINTLSKGTAPGLMGKISSLLSFLNIAFDIRMISEMNFNILKKEFIELKQFVEDFTVQDQLWLKEFISKPSTPLLESQSRNSSLETKIPSSVSNKKEGTFNKGQNISTGYVGTRIGVQKGSTLLKALGSVGHKDAFEALRNKRREEIISIIKNYPNGISIKDIMLAVRGLGEGWGEKTLQRELISMVKDNVLKKTGEKRWSQYFLN